MNESAMSTPSYQLFHISKVDYKKNKGLLLQPVVALKPVQTELPNFPSIPVLLPMNHP